jgi:PAS domain S-box-containing protein
MNINSQNSASRNSNSNLKNQEFQNNDPKNNPVDFFRNIFHQSKAVTLIIDPHCGTIIEANQAAAKFYQHTVNELIGKQISEINILDAEQVRNEMQLAKNEERNFFNFQHRLKNGEIKHVEVFSNPIQIGDKVYLHSVIHESEEKAALRHDSIKFREIAKQSHVTIVITDLTGKITFVNPKFTELTGYTEEEAIGQNPRILKSGKTPASTFKSMWRSISAGKSWTGHLINRRKNGELFHEKAHLSPLFEESKHIGYLAIKEDITVQIENKEKVEKLNHQLRENLDELHAAYEELNTINEILKEEREQFISLLDSIPEPIYVTEKDTQRILYANQKTKDVVGRDIVGEKCYKAIQNKTEKCDFCKSDEVIKEKKTCYWEHFNQQLQKHFYIIDRHITWLDGKDAHFQMSIDISKMKAIEKELLKTRDDLKEHRDQLIESNATKDKFFSIISHDLKNPFNSIMGLAAFLQDKIDKYDKETIAKYAGHIYNASHASYKLLQNLLEWSRSQMGKITFYPQEYSLSTIIDDAVTSNYSQANNKNISINIKADTAISVFADYNMLNTTIRNLLTNAIKFSPKGKKIEIEAQETDLFTEIKIIDHGKGMSPEIVKKLFKISEKVTTPGTENESGTGLGLLLCKEFIDKHEGTITVESKEGKGSTFIISLPKNHD